MAALLKDAARFCLVLFAFYLFATGFVVIWGDSIEQAEIEATKLVALWALTKTIWPKWGE